MKDDNTQQYLQQIGERLRGVRLLMGITQKQAAEATGMSQCFLSLVERGQKSVCTARIISLIRYYKVPYEMIFGSEDNDYNLCDFPAGGSTDISLELLNILVGNGSSDRLLKGTSNCLKLVIYIIFRTVYRENPKNSEKLFSIDYDDAMNKVNRIMAAAPEGISSFIQKSRDVKASNFEIPPEKNAELRAFIAECEYMLNNTRNAKLTENAE